MGVYFEIRTDFKALVYALVNKSSALLFYGYAMNYGIRIRVFPLTFVYLRIRWIFAYREHKYGEDFSVLFKNVANALLHISSCGIYIRSVSIPLVGISVIFGGIYVDIEDTAAVASLIAELFGVYGISTALEKMTFSETKIIYDGQDDQVKYAVDAFNRMIYEGLVTFNYDALTLVRYGASASDSYTKIAHAASARTETKNQPAEYVRIENALECNTLFSISLGESVLFSREKLMSALRLIDALYIGY